MCSIIVYLYTSVMHVQEVLETLFLIVNIKAFDFKEKLKNHDELSLKNVIGVLFVRFIHIYCKNILHTYNL